MKLKNSQLVAWAMLISFAIASSGLTAACTPPEDDGPYSYGEDHEYTVGYEHGRESGYEDGYTEGYDEGQTSLLDCAEGSTTDLYYGPDEYEAIPIEDLRNCLN